MERRPNLVRRSGLVALAVLLAGGLSACGGSGPVGRTPAAVVDGREISAERVLDLSRAYATYYRNQLADNPTITQFELPLAGTRGDGAGTYGMDQAVASLNELMVFEAVQAELTDNDIEISDDERADARKALEDGISASVTDGGGSAEAAKEAVDAIPEELLTVTAATRAAYTKLAELTAEPLTAEERDARAEELLAEQQAALPYCIELSYATTLEVGEADKARIDGGEDFATVAAQTVNPADGATGGVPYGCGSAEQLAELLGQDVASVELGDVLGPLDLTAQIGAIALVRISSVTGPTAEQAAGDIEQQLAAEDTAIDPSTDEGRQALQLKGQDLLRAASVTVNPRYGSWDAATGTLSGPVDPLATTTTLPTVPGASEPTAS